MSHTCSLRPKCACWSQWQTHFSKTKESDTQAYKHTLLHTRLTATGEGSLKLQNCLPTGKKYETIFSTNGNYFYHSRLFQLTAKFSRADGPKNFPLSCFVAVTGKQVLWLASACLMVHVQSMQDFPLVLGGSEIRAPEGRGTLTPAMPSNLPPLMQARLASLCAFAHMVPYLECYSSLLSPSLRLKNPCSSLKTQLGLTSSREPSLTPLLTNSLCWAPTQPTQLSIAACDSTLCGLCHLLYWPRRLLVSVPPVPTTAPVFAD